jgi:hypothetical protein
MPEQQTERPPTPLNGWKEIASYLGKSVRSVQRWETTLGLPVHRIRTPDGQSIYAYRDEIDAWRRQLDAPPPSEPEDPADPESLSEASAAVFPREQPGTGRRRWRLGLLAAGLALFTAGLSAGWWLARPSALAVTVAFAGRSLQGLSAQGAPVWILMLEADISPALGSTPPLLDVDGDGEAEWLVPVHFGPTGTMAANATDALYCLSRTGVRKWVVRPEQNLSYPDRLITGPWTLTAIAFTPTSPRRIWVSYAHHTGPFAHVVEIDSAGAATLRYVQVGRIHSLVHWRTPSGGFLAVGGTLNDYRRPTVALLSEQGRPASFPEAAPGRPLCRECPALPPQRVYLLPDSELSPANHELYPYVASMTTPGTFLKADFRHGGGRAQFFLNPDMTPGSFDYTQQHWAAHEQLERSGRLNHRASDCPERTAVKTIRAWTAGGGWLQWAFAPGATVPARPATTDDGL